MRLEAGECVIDELEDMQRELENRKGGPGSAEYTAISEQLAAEQDKWSGELQSRAQEIQELKEQNDVLNLE